MKNEQFCRSFTEVFHKFSPFRETIQVARRFSKETQQLVLSFPGAVAETIEFPETDTSPAKTMTVLQSAQPGIDIGEGVSYKTIDPVGSVQSR